MGWQNKAETAYSTIEVWHGSAAQKSYGKEKRYVHTSIWIWWISELINISLQTSESPSNPTSQGSATTGIDFSYSFRSDLNGQLNSYLHLLANAYHSPRSR